MSSACSSKKHVEQSIYHGPMIADPGKHLAICRAAKWRELYKCYISWHFIYYSGKFVTRLPGMPILFKPAL